MTITLVNLPFYNTQEGPSNANQWLISTQANLQHKKVNADINTCWGSPVVTLCPLHQFPPGSLLLFHCACGDSHSCQTNTKSWNWIFSATTFSLNSFGKKPKILSCVGFTSVETHHWRSQVVVHSENHWTCRKSVFGLYRSELTQGTK